VKRCFTCVMSTTCVVHHAVVCCVTAQRLMEVTTYKVRVHEVLVESFATPDVCSYFDHVYGASAKPQYMCAPGLWCVVCASRA
jgi:hypothetical protein